MKIKRFVAPDMRTAFRLVRQEHGPDAVILSNRRIEEGIEIVAASNYDEALVKHALATVRPPASHGSAASAPATAPATTERSRPAVAEKVIAALTRRQTSTASAGKPAVAQEPHMPNAAHTAPRAPEPIFTWPDEAAVAPRAQQPAQASPTKPAAPRPAAAPAKAPPAAPSALPPPSAPQNDAQLARLHDEMAQMRQMLEREMNRLGDERLRISPAHAQAMQLMEDYGFNAGLSRQVVARIPADTELSRSRGLMLGLLSKQLPITALDPLEKGGIIALIGPTGAGKTTTIAKLAARFAARHAARDVALVTTDTLRVGGREQLHSYGRQLGIAVHEANHDHGLNALLERLHDYKLVLIDTPGMGQRDRALVAQLSWLRASRQVTSLLVLPANAHIADLDEVVRRFASARPQGAVLTKLDETGRFGSALSVVVDHQLPITWVTDGQHVPEDLHRANAANLVLRLEDLRRAADKPSTPESNHAVA